MATVEFENGKAYLLTKAVWMEDPDGAFTDALWIVKGVPEVYYAIAPPYLLISVWSRGQDGIEARLSPDDARWFAKQLLEIAEELLPEEDETP